MARTFKHLRLPQCLTIAYFLKQGYSKAAIARELKVQRSTITRELRRNQDKTFGYHVLIANDLAHQRQQDQKLRKIERRPHLKDYVIDHLQAGWSPEQIVERMKLIGGKAITSHESIYAYIYS